jgi:hypothetical protein
MVSYRISQGKLTISHTLIPHEQLIPHHLPCSFSCATRHSPVKTQVGNGCMLFVGIEKKNGLLISYKGVHVHNMSIL